MFCQTSVARFELTAVWTNPAEPFLNRAQYQLEFGNTAWFEYASRSGDTP